MIEIAESDAIARYLSRKFGYLGSNIFEETVIDQFVSSSRSVPSVIFTKYFDAKTPEAKAEVMTKLMTDTIEPWMRYHEQHLADNGSNGHYVGATMSLADITTAGVVSVVNGLWSADIITKEKSPALWKVYSNVVSTPSYVAWTQTESFKTLAAGNVKALGY